MEQAGITSVELGREWAARSKHPCVFRVEAVCVDGVGRVEQDELVTGFQTAIVNHQFVVFGEMVVQIGFFPNVVEQDRLVACTDDHYGSVQCHRMHSSFTNVTWKLDPVFNTSIPVVHGSIPETP